MKKTRDLILIASALVMLTGCSKSNEPDNGGKQEVPAEFELTISGAKQTVSYVSTEGDKGYLHVRFVSQNAPTLEFSLPSSEAGTYQLGDGITRGSFSGCLYSNSTPYVKYELKSGTVEVNKNNDVYEIKLNGQSSSQNEMTAYFRGKLNGMDDSSPVHSDFENYTNLKWDGIIMQAKEINIENNKAAGYIAINITEKETPINTDRKIRIIAPYVDGKMATGYSIRNSKAPGRFIGYVETSSGNFSLTDGELQILKATGTDTYQIRFDIRAAGDPISGIIQGELKFIEPTEEPATIKGEWISTHLNEEVYPYAIILRFGENMKFEYIYPKNEILIRGIYIVEGDKITTKYDSEDFISFETLSLSSTDCTLKMTFKGEEATAKFVKKL